MGVTTDAVKATAIAKEFVEARLAEVNDPRALVETMLGNPLMREIVAAVIALSQTNAEKAQSDYQAALQSYQARSVLGRFLAGKPQEPVADFARPAGLATLFAADLPAYREARKRLADVAILCERFAYQGSMAPVLIGYSISKKYEDHVLARLAKDEKSPRS
jgi:hypothetical protein